MKTHCSFFTLFNFCNLQIFDIMNDHSNACVHRMFFFSILCSPDQKNHFSYQYLVLLKDSAMKCHFFQSLVADDTIVLPASHYFPLQIEPDFRYGFSHVRLVQRRRYQFFLQFFDAL